MLWLLRHAEAAEGSPDAARPLTAKGLRDAHAAGLALKAMRIELDTCLSSPKLRALQTAELACEPLGLEIELVEALAADSFDAEDLAIGRGHTLLVGHNPSITFALNDLTGSQATLKKCALAGIDQGELKLLLTARELRAIANGDTDE
jgi:phosphohistidine phosphatase